MKICYYLPYTCPQNLVCIYIPETNSRVYLRNDGSSDTKHMTFQYSSCSPFFSLFGVQSVLDPPAEVPDAHHDKVHDDDVRCYAGQPYHYKPYRVHTLISYICYPC